MVDVALAQDTVDQTLNTALTKLRDAVVQASEINKPLLLNLGMLGPDFNRIYTHDEIWPAQHVFNWSTLQNQWLQKLKRHHYVHGAAASAELVDEITSDVDEFDYNSDITQGAQCSNVNQKR